MTPAASPTAAQPSGIDYGATGVSFNDTYTRSAGTVLVTGGQVPLVAGLVLRADAERRGKDIRAMVTGYPGSPMAGTFTEGPRVSDALFAQGVDFWPAPNEAAAINMARGTQHVGARGKDRVDGVSTLVVVKGPGGRQGADYLTQANFDGTMPDGGAVLIVGEDPGGLSTTYLSKEGDYLNALHIPVLTPSSISQFAECVVLATQFSRQAGCWMGVTVTPDIAEDWSMVDLEALYGVKPVKAEGLPQGLNFNPAHSRHIQGPLQKERQRAVEKLVDAHGLNRVPQGWEGGRAPQLGIVAGGASYAHVRQALYDLGITQEKAAHLGIRLLEAVAPQSISTEVARRFAQDVPEVLVVEELNDTTERMMREKLYDLPVRPRVVGRARADGTALLAGTAHDPAMVALAIADRVLAFTDDADLKQKVTQLKKILSASADPAVVNRLPDLCPGCPHGLSTLPVAGSAVLTATSCSVLRSEGGFTVNPPVSRDYTPMGGETSWAGEGPYSATPHAIQNMGDGTFFHSGLNAIRSAVQLWQRGMPYSLTFQVLHNRTTAMTGGQAFVGGGDIMDIARQIRAEGVNDIVVASAGNRWQRTILKAAMIRTFGRARAPKVVPYDAIPAEKLRLQNVAGVTALIADKECATEERRKRARGKEPQPDTRAVINESVCEGCGDCSNKAGRCAAINYVKTELGPKSLINPTICNVDLYCIKGFCPALVTVKGRPRVSDYKDIMRQAGLSLSPLQTPQQPTIKDHYSVLTPGIGGQGATLVGRILGWATAIQNKATGGALHCAGHDAAGLAQKGGKVASHFKLGTAQSEGMQMSKISVGAADLVLACDAVHAAAPEMLRSIGPQTVVVVNTGVEPVIQAKYDPATRFHDKAILGRIRQVTTRGQYHAFNASAVSKAITGSTLAANMVMLGYAAQKGLIPLDHEAITAAIALNKTAVKDNLAAFEWGRRCAQQPDIAKALEADVTPVRPLAETLEQKIAMRADILEAYRDAAAAATYRKDVEAVRQKDIALGRTTPEQQLLTGAVAEGLFHALYSKDEFEVARLYQGWRHTLGQQYDQITRVTFHFGPALWGALRGSIGKVIPLPEKIPVPARVAMPVLNMIARMKGLRDKPYNPFSLFGFSSEHRLNRAILTQYRASLARMMEKLGSGNISREDYLGMVKEAQRPLAVRGYGHVRMAQARAAGYIR